MLCTVETKTTIVVFLVFHTHIHTPHSLPLTTQKRRHKWYLIILLLITTLTHTYSLTHHSIPTLYHTGTDHTPTSDKDPRHTRVSIPSRATHPCCSCSSSHSPTIETLWSRSDTRISIRAPTSHQSHGHTVHCSCTRRKENLSYN